MTKLAMKSKPPEPDGVMRKNVRFFMTHDLWQRLQARALEEGKRAGRPRSVSAVMRTMLEAGITRGAK